MMESLKTWIIGITVASMLLGAADTMVTQSGIKRVLRLAGGILLGHMVGSMMLNSLALRLFYGYAWAVLAARIPNALVLAGAEFVLVRVLLANHALMEAARGGRTGRRS